ncbi:Polynucleotide 5'-hydroxyl-kinase grc3 [Paecilomyces lecythidis]|uniref:Polynucleotide 5'-hydroxyl-kinase GRC3 n=1 Tax=Paecilomyces lecythidis TaxID=3004212 RepID=A0ABR3YDP9_9EURO
MKRKVEKQQSAAPVSAVSAIAARRARQPQQQVIVPISPSPDPRATEEPPTKKTKPSPPTDEKWTDSEKPRPDRRRRKGKLVAEKRQDDSMESAPQESEPLPDEPSADESRWEEENEDITMADGIEEEALAQNEEDESYESPTNVATEIENFPLSKTRLNKSSIVYADENRLCVRIKEKMNLVAVGQYDIWVKRGVISLMGAKLHPSPNLYRVYAPSTHSLPVIKCVTGIEGYAEVEISSCHSGMYRLGDLSPLYQRIWNSKNTAADKATLNGNSRRTFSVLYTSSDDPLGRHLRPLHLEKKWSAAIKHLSQKVGGLRVLVCGPKASGKSTFSRYLQNHLLSPAPQTENGYSNTDGVAFLDLDPGQPEFSPMGEVYLAHLRTPCFGPPFSHPSLDGSKDGSILRSHHIGATSPKEDPDHYVLAATDLMDHYKRLLADYPQCSLIINFPGWIFGLGLEVATWLIKSLGLSDVVYMSEKGPSEVADPLAQAASEAMVNMITLPSQPTEYVTRSSAQLRSMQMQSYFHKSQPAQLQSHIWSDAPLNRIRPLSVDYAGSRQGILGVMVMGAHHNPELLHDLLDGSIVSLVAVENQNAITGLATNADIPEHAMEDDDEQSDVDPDTNMDDATESPADESSSQPTLLSSLQPFITRTQRENLPYLFIGSGSCTPLNPKYSRSLGLALVRGIHPSSHKLDLVTPIPPSTIRDALETGQGIVLVRGQLDNPNWAIAEEYYAARAAERRHSASVVASRKAKAGQPASNKTHTDARKQKEISQQLRDRVRRAGNVPWMTVVEDTRRSARPSDGANHKKTMWKLRKKAYPGSESETDW